MINPSLFFLILCPGLLIGSGLYYFRLQRSEGCKPEAALTGLALGIPLGYAGAKLTYLAAVLGADLAAYGAKALIDPNPEKLSFAGACIGFAAGTVLSARLHHIPIAKALDAFSLPGCLMVFFGRLAQGALGVIGFGDYTGESPLKAFPFSVADEWGDPYLAVFRFEAFAALLCGLWLYLYQKKARGTGSFGRAAFALCSAQLFLELLKTTWIPLVISFIRLDQVLCALVMLWVLIRSAKQRRGIRRLIVFAACLIVNGVTQFIMDKPYLFLWVFPENVEMWIGERLYTLGLLIIAITALVSLTLALPRKEDEKQTCAS